MHGSEWFPFGKDKDVGSEFDVDISLNLNRIAPRARELLLSEVAEFSMSLWPTCDYPNSDDDDYETSENERVEIVAFGPDCSVASHINLDDWLRSSFASGHCTDEQEIKALERVKAACEEMILLRQNRIEATKHESKTER